MKNFYVNSFYGSFSGNGKASITVNFDTQEGEILSPQKFYLGETYKNLPTPTREGYTFIGWFEDVDKTIQVTNDSIVDPEVLTLYAKWQIIEYTVRFLDYNGSELKTEQVPHGSAATPPSNPSRVGYTFTNWDKEYAVITSNLDIKAIYTINSYILTFNATGGQVTPQSIEVVYNQPYGELPTPTKDYKEFAGWFTLEEGGVQVTSETLMGAASTTIYAHWNDISGSVTFNLKSSSGISLGTLEKQGVAGESESITFDVKNGYTTPLAQEITYQLEPQSIDITYTLIDYTITYNLDSGVAEGNPASYNIESENITLINPTKENFEFAGWAGTELLEPTLTVIINKGSYGNREYTATYTALDTVIITEDKKETITEDSQKVIIME